MHTRNIFFSLWLAVILFLPAAIFSQESAGPDTIGSNETGSNRVGSGEPASEDIRLEDNDVEYTDLESMSLDNILDRAYRASEDSEEGIKDYVCQSTFIIREPQKDGSAKTIMVENKTTYFKSPDQERDVFLSVTKKGKTLSPEKLAEYQKKTNAEIRKAQEQKNNANEDDKEKSVSFSMSAEAPWAPEQRALYTFKLLPPDTIRGFPCYVVRMKSKEKSDELLNGSSWFHQDLFEVVKLDFQPAKNPRFVKKAHIILDFEEVPPGHWLPVEMRTEAAGGILFIKKSFQLHQTWRDYQVNVGLDDSLFYSQEY